MIYACQSPFSHQGCVVAHLYAGTESAHHRPPDLILGHNKSAASVNSVLALGRLKHVPAESTVKPGNAVGDTPQW